MLELALMMMLLSPAEMSPNDTITYIVIERDSFTAHAFSQQDSQWVFVKSFPVAVGTRGFTTPTLIGTIAAKRVNPAWFAPRARWAGRVAGTVVPWRSRGNPFRAQNDSGIPEGYFFAIGGTSLGLHTTDKPRSIGTRASHGCVRLQLKDARWLNRVMPIGATVEIR
jgi:lipoprotein-anchoring transpeptidase ErfK/SrfK